jgi:hypothetical protein
MAKWEIKMNNLSMTILCDSITIRAADKRVQLFDAHETVIDTYKLIPVYGLTLDSIDHIRNGNDEYIITPLASRDTACVTSHS